MQRVRKRKPGVITANSDQEILQRYEQAIRAYRKRARAYETRYRNSKVTPMVLSTLVLLCTIFYASESLNAFVGFKDILSVATPVLAAALTIIVGLSKSFENGSAWRDMTMHAQWLERERDRFLATAPAERVHEHELAVLNAERITSFPKHLPQREDEPKSPPAIQPAPDVPPTASVPRRKKKKRSE